MGWVTIGAGYLFIRTESRGKDQREVQDGSREGTRSAEWTFKKPKERLKTVQDIVTWNPMLMHAYGPKKAECRSRRQENLKISWNTKRGQMEFWIRVGKRSNEVPKKIESRSWSLALTEVWLNLITDSLWNDPETAEAQNLTQYLQNFQRKSSDSERFGLLDAPRTMFWMFPLCLHLYNFCRNFCQ